MLVTKSGLSRQLVPASTNYRYLVTCPSPWRALTWKQVIPFQHFKQAPAELEEDASPKGLIEVVFSVKIYFFITLFDFYLLLFTFCILYTFYLLHFTFYLLHFTFYLLHFNLHLHCVDPWPLFFLLLTFFILNFVFSLWSFVSCLLTFVFWLLTFDFWLLNFDFCLLSCVFWLLTFDFWLLTRQSTIDNRLSTV